MKILSFSFRNFNSYGNITQQIELDRLNGHLYLLLGNSGVGKSTLTEVISYSIYGKIERKNKTDLPNRLNKNLWCQISLVSKGKHIIITRGIAPNLFEVKIDGEDFETAGNINMQDYLESELFEIPYQVFKNIIVLSINDFKSFLTMSPGDKRNIIDRLFGFTIINQMKDDVKNERKVLKDTIKTLDDEIKILEESVESINKKLTILSQSNKDDKQKLIEEYINSINTAKESCLTSKQDLEKIKDIENKISILIDNDKNKYNDLKHKSLLVEKTISLYKNSKCPTCSADLNTDSHIQLHEDAVSENNITKVLIDDLTTSIIENKSKLSKLTSKIKIIESSIIKSELIIKQYTNESRKIQEKETDNESYLLELSTESYTKIKDRKNKYSGSLGKDKFLSIIEDILGDDGVKNLAMKTILPSLNQNINMMCKQIHLPYSISFDDKFNCRIQSLGEEINPKSMSTGERKKADFIIIIALLKILKVRYPSINLLFLDEIFSSIDSSGTYEIIKILSDISNELQINTWVINHAELPSELFDTKIEVVKEGGFSKLIRETLS